MENGTGTPVGLELGDAAAVAVVTGEADIEGAGIDVAAPIGEEDGVGAGTGPTRRTGGDGVWVVRDRMSTATLALMIGPFETSTIVKLVDAGTTLPAIGLKSNS